MSIDDKSLSACLVSGDPIDFKRYPDGSMVVIAANGQKFRFSPAQVDQALQSLKPKPKSTSASRPNSQPPPKRGRPPSSGKK